ncbi:MAG: MerR family transcriptional regulator [Hespellia sp.]|jgi:DNA-binding transcriptional MerR regulator|nr:MerR family transcriptional regulator [Hespellia sp.]
MDEQKNMISEAAKKVDVESHVLRYWEEELHIPINRTEMGHRYYTKEDIQLFCCIKKLKDEGVSIKELKNIVPELLEARKSQLEKSIAKNHSSKPTPAKQEPSKPSPAKAESAKVTPAKAKPSKTDIVMQTMIPSQTSDKQDTEIITDAQLKQVRELIGTVLSEIVTSNNDVLTKDISQTVTSSVMREMDFLVQAKERREEEHFRKLDVLIRQQQTIRRENTKPGPIGKLKRMLT